MEYNSHFGNSGLLLCRLIDAHTRTHNMTLKYIGFILVRKCHYSNVLCLCNQVTLDYEKNQPFNKRIIIIMITGRFAGKHIRDKTKVTFYEASHFLTRCNKHNQQLHGK